MIKHEMRGKGKGKIGIGDWKFEIWFYRNGFSFDKPIIIILYLPSSYY